jgi:hypothetical protein
MMAAWAKKSITVHTFRVSGLGELSSIGRLFTSGSFLENYSRSPHIWATLFLGTSYAIILTKNSFGPHFGRFFSQTHLVTLDTLSKRRNKNKNMETGRKENRRIDSAEAKKYGRVKEAERSERSERIHRTETEVSLSIHRTEAEQGCQICLGMYMLPKPEKMYQMVINYPKSP